MKLCQEDIAHINIVNWFHKEFPDLADDFYHFANERRCSVMQGRLLKRKGVKKGVADFFLALPSNGKSGLWIELKSEKGKLSPEQKLFLARMSLRGFEALAVWGEDAAKAVIMTYLNREFNMSSLRVTILTNDGYESFLIPDVGLFLTHLRNSSKIAEKYKRMNEDEFREWVEDGITHLQFEKLKALNNL